MIQRRAGFLALAAQRGAAASLLLVLAASYRANRVFRCIDARQPVLSFTVDRRAFSRLPGQRNLSSSRGGTRRLGISRQRSINLEGAVRCLATPFRAFCSVPEGTEYIRTYTKAGVGLARTPQSPQLPIRFALLDNWMTGFEIVYPASIPAKTRLSIRLPRATTIRIAYIFLAETHAADIFQTPFGSYIG